MTDIGGIDAVHVVLLEDRSAIDLRRGDERLAIIRAISRNEVTIQSGDEVLRVGKGGWLLPRFDVRNGAGVSVAMATTLLTGSVELRMFDGQTFYWTDLDAWEPTAGWINDSEDRILDFNRSSRRDEALAIVQLRSSTVPQDVRWLLIQLGSFLLGRRDLAVRPG